MNYERQIYKIYEIQVRQRSVVIILYPGRIDFYGAGCIYQDRIFYFLDFSCSYGYVRIMSKNYDKARLRTDGLEHTAGVRNISTVLI